MPRFKLSTRTYQEVSLNISSSYEIISSHGHLEELNPLPQIDVIDMSNNSQKTEILGDVHRQLTDRSTTGDDIIIYPESFSDEKQSTEWYTEGEGVSKSHPIFLIYYYNPQKNQKKSSRDKRHPTSKRSDTDRAIQRLAHLEDEEARRQATSTPHRPTRAGVALEFE
ncbi:hypothetical protein EMCRGX_G013553 [Ephydatia muelleri]